jgi:beta-glucosidase
MLLRIVKEYPAIPIMICENGAAYPDVVRQDGTVDDPLRIAYLESHIEAMADAIEAGVEVSGYFVWSFCDNFEWSLGYDKRFGLIRVDYETLERTVKASGHWYRTFLAS